MLERALKLIEAQQGSREKTPILWMLGEQVKDICRAEPRAAELVVQDLEGGMKLLDLKKKLDELAKKHKVGNQSVVTPMEADALIREFFGLPERGAAPEPEREPERGGKVLSLFDLL